MIYDFPVCISNTFVWFMKYTLIYDETLYTVKQEMLVAIIFGGFENITI